MQIEGIIIKVLDPVTGQGKNGAWQKQDYLLETRGQYPKKILFSAWGDKLPEPKEGDDVIVSIDLESREYNGKYYTEVRAFKIEYVHNRKKQDDKEFATPVKQSPQQHHSEIQPPEGADDLPF